MATVPGVPAPSVAASSAPLPLQQVNPPAAAFGALAGGADLSELGSTASKVSDTLEAHAQAFQAINNKQAADAKFVGLSTQLNDAVTDFKNNNLGVDPTSGLPKGMANLGDLYTKFETMRSDAGQGLSPMAQVEFEANSRRAISYAQSNARDFAVTQRKQAIIGTSQASIKLAQDNAAASDDPSVMDQSIATIATQHSLLADQLGLSQDQSAEAFRGDVGKIWQGKIRLALDAGDYPKAIALRDSHLDDMTIEQTQSVSGAIKVGQNAYEASTQKMAWIATATGNPSAAVNSGGEQTRGNRNNNPLNVTNLPNGSWQGQTGSDGRFAQFATPDAGRAAADQNLAAYGSKHGINTLQGVISRWAPAGENDTAAYIQTVSKATGIAPNAPIDLSDPKVRKTILTAMEPVESGGQSAPAPSVPPVPQLLPNADPQQWKATADLAAERYVNTQYPDNPVKANAVLSGLVSANNLLAQQTQANQGAAFDRLSSAVEQQKAQDTSGLSTAYAGASGDLALIQSTPRYAKALDAQTKANANELTPERQTAIHQLDGMFATSKTDPSPFLNADIRSMDLPPGVTRTFLKEQDTLKDKVTKGVQEDTAVNKAMHSIQGQAALHSLDLSPTDSNKNINPQYYQFAGSLQAEFESFESQYKRAPNPKEMDGIISQVTAKQGARPGFLGMGGSAGTPAFQVPDDARSKIVDYYHRKGLGEPTEQDVGRMYRQVSRGGN